MKRKRGGMFLLVLGLVLALAVGFQVYQFSSRAAEAKVETTSVLVMLQDVPERAVLTSAVLALQITLPEAVPPGALTKPEQAVGKMTTTRLYAGETVIAAKLADTSGKSGVSYALAKGRVVITIPASDIVTTGAIRPGDRVDLLVTLLPPDSASTDTKKLVELDELLPSTTQTTMQNLEVLGIGPYGAAPTKDTNNQGPSNLLTFAVDHQDALMIKALKDTKTIRMEMVLRAAGDEEIAQTTPVTLKAIVERYRLRAP